MDLSLRLSSAAELVDPEIMEQNLQEWIIHRWVVGMHAVSTRVVGVGCGWREGRLSVSLSVCLLSLPTPPRARCLSAAGTPRHPSPPKPTPHTPSSEHVRKKRYQIIAAPICEPMARRLQAKYPERCVCRSVIVRQSATVSDSRSTLLVWIGLDWIDLGGLGRSSSSSFCFHHHQQCLLPHLTHPLPSQPHPRHHRHPQLSLPPHALGQVSGRHRQHRGKEGRKEGKKLTSPPSQFPSPLPSRFNHFIRWAASSRTT